MSERLADFSWNCYFGVAPWHGPLNRPDHRSARALNPRPTRRGEDNDCDAPKLEILLVFEIRIGCHEDCVALLLRRIKQLAVLEPGPAALIGGGDFMLRR